MGKLQVGKSWKRNSVLARSPLPIQLPALPKFLTGLALLLLTSCSRSALEQAFAPGSPVDETATQAETTSPAATSSGAASSSSSSAPGGGDNPRSEASSTSKPSLFGKNQGNPGEERREPASGADGKDDKPQSSNQEGNVQKDDQPKPDSQGSQLGTVRLTISEDDIPAELRETVVDVWALGVLTSVSGAAGEASFEANQPVTRGQFAQWLLEANNALYGDRPALQIRAATGDGSSVFKDVPADSPQYPVIQGLAEAGILPSSLSGAQEQINFRPDELLSREDMLLWKVPLDVRQALPSSNLEAVKEAWGFQDASKISAPALRAVLADHSNGDQAVIRRIFGYTTIFQPQKPVTQAEAAAALGYFGNNAQGISTADVLNDDQ